MTDEHSVLRVLLIGPVGDQPWCRLEELADALRARHYDVVVVGDTDGPTLPWPETYHARRSGWLRAAAALVVDRAIAFNRSRRRIAQMVDRAAPDIVLVWDPAVAVACRVGRRRPTRVVFVVSEYDPADRRSRLERAAAIALADSVVVSHAGTSALNLARQVVAPPFDGIPAAAAADGAGWAVLAPGSPEPTGLEMLRRHAEAAGPARVLVVDGRRNDDAAADDRVWAAACDAHHIEHALNAQWLEGCADVVDPSQVLRRFDHRHRAALRAARRLLVRADAVLGASVAPLGAVTEVERGWARFDAVAIPNDLDTWVAGALVDPAQPRAGVVGALGVTVDACPVCGARQRTLVRVVGPSAIFRCDACPVTYASPKVADEKVYTDGYHDGTGAFGTDYVHARWYCERLSDDRLAFLARAGVQPSTMIDLGTGLGHFVHRSRASGWVCDGLELVPEAVRQAKDLYGFDLIEARLLDFVAEARYEVAALGQTLEHFTNPVEVLEHIRKEILTPNGMLLIEVPHVDGLPRRLRRGRWGHWQPGDHVLFMNDKSARHLLERAGYEVVRIETVSGVFAGLGAVGVAYGLGLLDPLSLWFSAARTARRVFGARRARGAASVAPVAPDDNALPATSTAERALLSIAAAVDRAGFGDHLRVIARAR